MFSKKGKTNNRIHRKVLNYSGYFINLIMKDRENGLFFFEIT